jgi:large-conductance mechanosensitive channel
MMQVSLTTFAWTIVNLLVVAAIIVIIVKGFCAVHKMSKTQDSILERLNEISETNKKIIEQMWSSTKE